MMTAIENAAGAVNIPADLNRNPVVRAPEFNSLLRCPIFGSKILKDGDECKRQLSSSEKTSSDLGNAISYYYLILFER